jgi:hypothetical protein
LNCSKFGVLLPLVNFSIVFLAQVDRNNQA